MTNEPVPGICITYPGGEVGWLTPVGWTPEIQPKPYTTPDLDTQADKAEPWDGGIRGHIVVQGIPIAIENPAGSTRSGTDANGKKWSVKMVHHYGFCKRRIGADGDGVDCFIGPNPEAPGVWIVNQVVPGTDAFDEHKVMIGFDSAEEARAAYHANYSQGWTGYHSMAEHTVEDFKDWLADERACRTIAKGAEHDAIPVGAHWVTAHPNGPGTKGHPLLIMPITGSHGTGRVIGGAGGKLNGLRLHGLKDPSQYKEEATSRAKDQRAAENTRRASMTPDEREEEKGRTTQAKADRQKAEEKFIQDTMGTVTGGQGGEQGGLFDEEDPKVAAGKHKERLKQAMGIAAAAEKRVTLDAEARGQAGLAQVGGDAPMDLDQILSETTRRDGPGYNRDLSTRAAAAGMTAEKLMAGVNEIREASGRPPKAIQSPEDAQAGAQAKVEVHKATKELQAARAGAMREHIKAALESNEDLAKILQARAELRQEYKLATAKKKGITFEPGYQMAVSTPIEHEDLVQGIHEKLLTQHMVGFLEEVGETFPEGTEVDPFKANTMEGMHASRGAGAFDLLHDVGLAALGQGVIDRDVVEALGPEGAAHVVARAIRTQFSPEDQKHVLDALEHHHLKEQEEDLPGVIQEAQDWKAKAAAFELEGTESARDLPAAVELQKNKLEALREARRTLGSTLGRMEARAALIAALQGTPLTEQQVPLGRMTPEKAVLTAGSLGLKDGGYSIDHQDGEAVLTINGQGMDSMIKPVDCAALGEREVAASIKQGQQDEDNWLPAGFANRQADRYSNPELEPPEFQRHHGIEPGDDGEAVKGKLSAWMGARLADGEKPEDILAHVYGGAKTAMAPEAQETWGKAIQEMVPLRITEKDAHGKPVPEIDRSTGKPIVINGKPMFKSRIQTPKEIGAALQPMMDAYMAANPAEAGTTLQGQRVDADASFHEALHRSLAADPRLTAAYIPPGELTHEHASHIRDFFYKEHFGGAKGSDEAKKWKFDQAVDALGPEPEKTSAEVQSMNLFAGMDEEDAGGGDTANSPQWIEWNNKRSELESEYQEDASKPTLWEQYIDRLGGTKFAQGAIQDVMKGRLNDAFHGQYGRLAGRTLQMTTSDISSAEAHLKMTLGDKDAQALENDRKAKQARIQKHGGGRFQAGSMGDRMKDAKAAQTLAAAEGGSLFDLSEEEEPTPAGAEEPAAKWEKPELAPGERFHLGTALENQLRSAMPAAQQAFQGRTRAVDVHEGRTMSGKFAQQQQSVKAICQLKRIGLFKGAGSGKTGIMLGALTALYQQGKCKKSILAVPSIVQAQFGAEAVQFIDPSSGFHVHAQPGESYEERLAAYRDPEAHAVVVTHQSLRDDTLKILAKHMGGTVEQARDFLKTAPAKESAAKVKDAFHAEGIDHNAFMVDEAHGGLDREGKEDSTLSKVLDAHSHNAEYAVMATGDPMKNDTSEIWSNLNKIDPHRYPAESKGEFLRRYKDDAPLAKRSMAQELSRYWFNGRVDVGKECYKSSPKVPLTAKQKTAMDQVELASGKLRTGDADPVKWAKVLAPAKFEGVPEAEHAGVAEQVRKAVGTMLEGARNKIINLDPEGGKMAEHVRITKERLAEGKPVVIFASNLAAVAGIHAAMEKAGIKVASLTGKDSSKDKAAKAGMFQRGEARVLVMSDAGATGLDLPQGKCVIQHDLPKTAMIYNQRMARIHRLGQKDDVENISLMADHPWETANMERVKRKQVLGEIFQDPSGFLDDSGMAGDLRDVRARAQQGKAAAA